MPKRKNKEEKWKRKLKKYEEKLKRRRRLPSLEDERYPPSSASSSPECVTPDRTSARSLYRADDSPPSPLLVELDTAVPPPPQPPSTPPLLRVTPPPKTMSPAPATLPILSSNNLEIEPLPAADPDLLQALGIFEAKDDEWGSDIVEDLAKRWEPSLKDGLNKDEKDQLLKKYPFPKNCQLMKPPILNPEIAAVLSDSAKNRDRRLEKKQSQLGSAFAILGRTMSDILTKSISTPDVLKNLSDLAKILADSHYSETETRRSLIIPMVDKAFIEPFKNRKRDTNLFGENLGEFIKSSRGIQKTGKLIQTATPSTSNLNSKGPASRYQQQRQRVTHRTGEMRAAQYQQFRRRAPFQPVLNNRAPPLTQPQQATALSAASRKQAAAPTHRRRQ